MRQIWHNLLFAHWSVPPAQIRRLIPECFEIDTFEGDAWIGVVPFTMSDVGLRGLPALKPFPELNVRTYVRPKDGPPGVWFFSLDAESKLAVWAANSFFHLPYFFAHMSAQLTDDTVTYTSRRFQHAMPEARLEAVYKPNDSVFHAEAGSLESWLTDRYCLYTVDRSGRPKVGHIHHAPWPLQRADAQIKLNSMASAAGIELPEKEPHLLYAERLDVAIWPLRSI